MIRQARPAGSTASRRPGRGKPNPQSSGGFTSVELLAVTAIVAILAAIVLFGSQGSDRSKASEKDGPTVPVIEAGPQDRYRAIAAGAEHSLALRSDGTVWSSGWNSSSLAGDGITERSTPVQVPDLVEVTAIDAGRVHSLALKNDATVWAWGYNTSGQLGDGSTETRLRPVRVLDDVAAIAAGNAHSLALKKDGTLWAWGSNNFGQVGDGKPLSTLRPVQVLDHVTAIEAGQDHSLALTGERPDTTVWIWGGVSGVPPIPEPVAVVGLVGVTALAGGAQSLVLKADGTVSVVKATDGVVAIEPVAGVEGVSGIAAGENHFLAQKSNGTVWAWGSNTRGQLGNGVVSTEPSAPVQVRGLGGNGFLAGVSALSGGTEYSMALNADGTVSAWGANRRGQLGNGITTPEADGATTTPVAWGPVPPVNDAFADGTVITGGAVVVQGSNRFATTEPAEPSHKAGAASSGASVWFRWTAPDSRPVIIDTVGSDFDTTLAVYAGDNLSSLTPVAQNDDTAPSRKSGVAFPATMGVEYHIVVDGGGFAPAAQGRITLNLVTRCVERQQSGGRLGGVGTRVVPCPA